MFHLSFTPLSLSSFESIHKSLNINLQSFHPELLQTLTESISSGYNGALLLCGASTEKISTLIDRCIIKQVELPKKLQFILAILSYFLTILILHSTLSQVLANLFGRMLSQAKEESFISVSFLQVCPSI